MNSIAKHCKRIACGKQFHTNPKHGTKGRLKEYCSQECARKANPISV